MSSSSSSSSWLRAGNGGGGGVENVASLYLRASYPAESTRDRPLINYYTRSAVGGNNAVDSRYAMTARSIFSRRLNVINYTIYVPYMFIDNTRRRVVVTRKKKRPLHWNFILLYFILYPYFIFFHLTFEYDKTRELECYK